QARVRPSARGRRPAPPISIAPRAGSRSSPEECQRPAPGASAACGCAAASGDRGRLRDRLPEFPIVTVEDAGAIVPHLAEFPERLDADFAIHVEVRHDEFVEIALE